MKKHITAIAVITLAAAILAGCSDKPEVTPGGANYTNSKADSTDSGNSSNITESTESTSNPEHAPQERFIYGEQEIPDIVHSNGDYNETYLFVNPDGRIDSSGMGKKRYDERTLESMVFETHTFGDYTIRLVGDDVRTDKEHFPGIIYTKDLRIEVEKNGENLPIMYSQNNYCEKYFSIYPVGNSYSEELLFEDQIGNYLDIYDTRNPIIAMRYFNADDIDEPLRKIVQFAWIENDQLVSQFTGTFAENTGVATGGCPIQFSTGSMADLLYSVYAVFAADEFKVENENTLIDEKAGIKYIFDFDKTDDVGHWFSTERIG